MTRLSKTVREGVRQRAEGRCEYCRKPEGYGLQSHQVDHIIPQKHKGTDELDNLAWACFQCNLCKGPNLASLDPETGTLTFLFHPRNQRWHDHFELVHEQIMGKTPIGRVTVDILQMNHEEQLATRRILIDSGLW